LKIKEIWGIGSRLELKNNLRDKKEENRKLPMYDIKENRDR